MFRYPFLTHGHIAIKGLILASYLQIFVRCPALCPATLSPVFLRSKEINANCGSNWWVMHLHGSDFFSILFHTFRNKRHKSKPGIFKGSMTQSLVVFKQIHFLPQIHTWGALAAPCWSPSAAFVWRRLVFSLGVKAQLRSEAKNLGLELQTVTDWLSNVIHSFWGKRSCWVSKIYNMLLLNMFRVMQPWRNDDANNWLTRLVAKLLSKQYIDQHLWNICLHLSSTSTISDASCSIRTYVVSFTFISLTYRKEMISSF